MTCPGTTGKSSPCQCPHVTASVHELYKPKPALRATSPQEHKAESRSQRAGVTLKTRGTRARAETKWSGTMDAGFGHRPTKGQLQPLPCCSWSQQAAGLPTPKPQALAEPVFCHCAPSLVQLVLPDLPRSLEPQGDVLSTVSTQSTVQIQPE